MGEERETRRVEKQYEIRMYGLVLIVLVAIFVALGAGTFVGYGWGHSEGSNDISVSTPEYCNARQSAGKVTITCNELDITAEELCKVTSPGIQDNLRVVMISSS